MGLHPLPPIRVPGLTEDATQIDELAQDVRKKTRVYFYKQALPCLCVVLMGGTGTGKSTLFNALCGAALSAAGMERPKTGGPIAYGHQDCPVEAGFPFPSLDVVRSPAGAAAPASGSPAAFTVLTHYQEDLSHLLVLDTPDLDSVAAAHRDMARDLYLLADALIFVTSQEKYADQVPHRFLETALDEVSPLFILFNKAEKHITDPEVRHMLQTHGSRLRERSAWVIPYLSRPTWESVLNAPAFQAFKTAFMEALSKAKEPAIRRTRRQKLAHGLSRDLERLTQRIKAEDKAATQWRSQLETLCHEIGQDLLQAEKARFSGQSREYLAREIRRLFDRYDVLARPRRILKGLVMAPLRLLGVKPKPPSMSKDQVLFNVREKSDLSMVYGAMERLHRRVLEELSPRDRTSPLFGALREPAAVLTHTEIRKMIYREQERLADWLETKFNELARGIPAGKKMGIYSTSLVWGVLIVSFETVVGGGFTLLDAALDSAIAPLVTKGAVELFAFHEIQKINRDLARQYQDGLLSIITRQCRRYQACLNNLMPDESTLKTLRETRLAIEAQK
ncbi:MAG: 50S ribosome-binding GTPase [Deltaproteobacteria bacterium]|nr:50S ribosome-binding GTPase [Deltaproteobacteria bacterium]